MHKKLIESLKPAIQNLRAQAKTQVPLLKKSINILIERGEQDVNNIETLLDYLLDAMQLGIGEEEFLLLLNYYAEFAPENAASYKRFYEAEFETGLIQDKP